MIDSQTVKEAFDFFEAKNVALTRLEIYIADAPAMLEADCNCMDTVNS